MDKSSKTYILLLAAFILLVIWLNFLPIDFPQPAQKALISLPAVLLTLVMAALAYWLARRTGVPDLLDGKVSDRQRFFYPALTGLALALAMVVIDLIIKLPADLNVAWPYSVLFYLQGAIFSDIQHFFPVVLLVWLVSNVILRGKYQANVYLAAAMIISLVEPVQMLAVMPSAAGLFRWFLAGYVLSFNLIQLYYLRRAGFLAMLSMRLGQYFIWHILWGALRLPLLFG